jgi:WD40 repeat protein
LAVAAGNAALVAQPLTDNFGDPLPDCAKARVGTARLRTPGRWDGAVLTPDGKYLLAPVRGGPVERIEVATGRTVEATGEKLPAHNGGESLYLSADGGRVARAANGLISTWDARTSRVLTKIESRAADCAYVALSADGSTLAVGAVADRLTPDWPLTVLVWDVGAEKRRLDVELVRHESARVALSGDGKLLATWGEVRPENPDARQRPDSLVRVWDATNGKSLWHVNVTRADYVAVAFAPGGKSVAVSDGFDPVVVRDARTGRELKRLTEAVRPIHRLVFSADGKTLASGSGPDATVQLWDTVTGKTIGTTKPPADFHGFAVGLAFTGEERLVAWGVEGAKAVVWEVPSGKVLSTTGGLSDPPTSVAFAPDGKELLTADRSWTISCWSPSTGKSLGARNLEAPADLIRELKLKAGRPGFPPPGRGFGGQLLPGGTRADVWAFGRWYVHDARTGKRLHDLGPSDRGDAPRLSTDGELTLNPLGVEAGGRPDSFKPLKVAVTELAANKKLAEIELPSPVLYRATRTSDGARLFTDVYVQRTGGNEDAHVLTLWELKTGKKLGEVKEPHTLTWFAPVLGSDGKTVYVTNGAGVLRAIDITTGKETRQIDTDDLVPCAGPVFSPDGKQFALGLCDPTNDGGPFDVRVFGAESGKPLRTFRGHAGAVTSLAFSPDGQALASGSRDTTVLLWGLSAIDKQK